MATISASIEPLMTASIGAIAARGLFRTLPGTVGAAPGSLDVVEVRELLAQLEASGRLFCTPDKPLPLKLLRDAITGGASARPREQRIPVRSDADVLAVQRATQSLTKGFFGVTDCVRLATAVSELARNIYMYAKEGTVTLRLCDELASYVFEVFAVDAGPGISGLESILNGQYHSRTGLGRGIAGTRALLDDLVIDTGPGQGTRIHGLKRTRKR